ncbi:PfkB family carbohydrate kinase [Microbacterium lacticum]|uniref:1-phosphofructokinase family hexose kinase n=1 Tax=Microbacterium lacticum TaxID=33885 RepID=UPI0028D3895A|nr:PfkB family carbohydrate kinase [Microbacterium lacticum]
MTIHTLGLTPALDVVYVLDEVQLGGIHRPPVVIRSAGGKSLNVARALALLGARTRAVVPLGGRIGDLVADLLTGSDVEVERIPTAVETRLCITACDTGSRRLTEFYEPVTEFDVPLAAVAERLRTIAPGEWLTVSGAMPVGTDAGEFAGILAAEADRGVLLAIDVHGPALGEIIDRVRPRLVKVNRHEAADLTGTADRERSSRQLVERGAGIAVVTDGEAGSVAATAAGEFIAVPPVDRPGLFAVGSGDCYLAGLVGSLERGADLERALAVAAEIGAANAQVPGAAVFDAPVLFA